MLSYTLAATALLQGVLAQLAQSQSQAFSQLGGSRQSTIIDETASAKYLFPPSRSSSSLVSRVGPCQGFELGGRIDYPMSGGVVSWSSLVDIENVRIRYSTSAEPSSQNDFRDALTNVTGGWRGQQCIDGPNFSALGLSEGDEITMQLVWESGPQSLESYECADVRLVSSSDFEIQNFDTSCSNVVLTTKQRRDDVSNPELVNLREEAEAKALKEANTGAGSGLTVVESGVIGAMVTLGVFVLVIVAGYFTGVVSFGKQRHQLEFRPKGGSFSTEGKTTSVV